MKNLCFWTVVLEKILKSPLDSKEIKPVNPKGNQPWIFIGSSDAEAPILWPPDAKSWLTWKDPDAGKDWGQEKGITKDEMAGWHHWLNGHEFEQALEDSEGQGSLVLSVLRWIWAAKQPLEEPCSCPSLPSDRILTAGALGSVQPTSPKLSLRRTGT